MIDCTMATESHHAPPPDDHSDDRGAELARREAELARREADLEAREAALEARMASAQEILDAAEQRDSVSDARDDVADHRARDRDRTEMLDTTSDYGTRWPERREAHLDRMHAQGDRVASRHDREVLAGVEDAVPDADAGDEHTDPA